MAKAEKNLDRDDDDAEEVKAPPPKKKGMMKFIIIGVAALTLVGVSVGVSVYVAKSMMSGDSADSHGGDPKKASKKEAAPKVMKVPVYYTFDPPFVVNFRSSNGTRFLQVSVEAMTYDPAVVPLIEQNLPVIRNNLIFLLSGLNSEEVSSQEGKVKIRAETLAEIQKILKERTGKTGVEEVYFTSFVMQ